MTRCSCYAKQKALSEAAAGSAKISSFFNPKQIQHTNVPSSSPELDYIPSHSISPDNTVSTSLNELPMSSPAPATDQSMGDVPRQQPAPAEGCVQETLEIVGTWADPTADDEDEPEMPDTYKTVQQLVSKAKRYKSMTLLVHLHAVKSFLELQQKYCKSSWIKNPITRASHVVVVSIGKGPYFARKVQALRVYIQKFQTLPPTNAGKHHAHLSLLNNERMAQAVRPYFTVLANGEVCGLSVINIHPDYHNFS
jgi:hypothetical protein